MLKAIIVISQQERRKPMKKKKWLVIALTVAMVLAMMPMSAFAITVDGGVETEKELIDAISAGGEVKLGANITLSKQSQQFKISGNSVTIDLNGFDLTREGTSSTELFYINNNGSLIINDSKGEGTITSSYPIRMMSNSTFILNGGNIVSPKGAAVDIYTGASNVLMEMNGGSVKGAADNTFGIRGSSNVKVNINDGLISADPKNRLAMYVSGDNDNAIEINVTGGRIEAEGQAVQAYSGATINVSGEAEIYSQTKVAISTQSGYGVVELNVNGGEIKTDGATSYAIQARDESVVNVEDGTISGGYAIKVSDEANINVSGGEIKSAANKDAISVDKNSDATVTLTGGTFSGKLDSIADYVPDGYELTNGTVEPTPADDPDVVAMTGGIYYKDLANAISMVGEGGTVELLADIEATETIEVPSGKDFTLDLDKYDISKGETFTGARLINVTDSIVSLRGEGQILAGDINGVTVRGGELDIAGSVTIKTDPAAGRQTVQAYGAKLTIGGDAYIEGYYAVTVYNSDLNNKGSISSKLIVNGGTIKGVPAGIAGNNLQSAGSKITVTGGTVQANEEGIAMYLPMESTVDVGGDAQITGGTAIEAKMGTITFRDNAVIKGTGAWNENEPENGGSSPEGSAFLGSAQMYGANAPGSTNPQYMTSPDLTVNFLGGTFISDNGNAITIYNTEKIDEQSVVVDVQNGDFQAAEGKGAIRYVTVSDGDNETVYDSEDGTYTATKDRTTVKVGADAAAAAVNTDGKTTYYTTVDEALAANSETAAEPVEIFVMADSEMAPEGLAHKNIKITTAPGVELEVFSDVSGMIVKATENADGTTTYELVAEDDFVINGSDLKVSADKTTVHEGEKATIKAEVTAELTGAEFVYAWYKDGKAIEGANGATFEAIESGEYYVSVKAVKTEGGATITSAEVNGPVLKITVEPHDFSGGWESDSLNHWQSCKDCDLVANKAEHVYGDWTVTKKATADEAGSQVRECAVCGYEQVQIIPATGTQTPDDDDSDTPKTGDSSNLVLWLALLALTGSALAGTVVYSRKK